MPLAATCVFEVRPVTGGANFGGGFNSAKSAVGTDRSQQAAAHVVIDNVAVTCTTPAANSNVLTFTAGYVPAAVDEGNLVAITAGTNINAGIYEISSVVVGTSWTVTGSTNLTTAGGAGSAVTGNMGGARSGFSNGTTTLQSRLLAGHICHVRGNGEAGWNEAVALTVSGAAGTPIQIIGYNTVRGDNPTGATRPSNGFSGGATVAFDTGAGVTNIRVRYLVMNGTGVGQVGFQIRGATSRVEHCRATGAGTGFGFQLAGVNLFAALLSCEADNRGGGGFELANSNGSHCEACNAHGNAGIGFSNPGGCFLKDCLSWANTSMGYQMATGPVVMDGCVADGNTGAGTDGLSFTGTPSGSTITNCIFSNNGRDGARTAANGNSIFADRNNFFGNVGVARTNFPTGVNDVAVDPQFTDRANGDFSRTGTNLDDIGFPQSIPSSATGSTVSAPDIGATQGAATPPPPPAVIVTLSPSAAWKW